MLRIVGYFARSIWLIIVLQNRSKEVDFVRQNLSKNGFRMFRFYIKRIGGISINALKNRSGLENFTKYNKLIIRNKRTVLWVTYILYHLYLRVWKPNCQRHKNIRSASYLESPHIIIFGRTGIYFKGHLHLLQSNKKLFFNSKFKLCALGVRANEVSWQLRGMNSDNYIFISTSK